MGHQAMTAEGLARARPAQPLPQGSSRPPHKANPIIPVFQMETGRKDKKLVQGSTATQRSSQGAVLGSLAPTSVLRTRAGMRTELKGS